MSTDIKATLERIDALMDENNPKALSMAVVLAWPDLIAELRRLWDVEAQKDAAYQERDRLVLALSRIFPAYLGRHPESDASWDAEWRWIVFVDLPTGQVSWHIHESEFHWFSHLNQRESSPWDGHTTEEKYQRLAALEDMQTHILRWKAIEEAAVRYREASKAFYDHLGKHENLHAQAGQVDTALAALFAALPPRKPFGGRESKP